MCLHKTSSINCTKDEKQIPSLRIIVYSKKSIYKEEAVELKNLGRHCSEYLARQSNLAAVNALKERSLLGQEDHQRSEIVLKS